MKTAEVRSRYREATRELLRETAFEAARDLLRSAAWSRISMAEVAAAAGVSRQTLYNEFGNREQFGQDLVRHEAEGFLAGVEAAMRANLNDPGAAIVAALRQFLDAAADDPLVHSLLAEESGGGLLPFVTTRGLPLVTWAGDRVAGVIAEGWPGTPEPDARLLADTLVRLAISYVTAPVGDPAGAANAAARLLTPFTDRTLTR